MSATAITTTSTSRASTPSTQTPTNTSTFKQQLPFLSTSKQITLPNSKIQPTYRIDDQIVFQRLNYRAVDDDALLPEKVPSKQFQEMLFSETESCSIIQQPLLVILEGVFLPWDQSLQKSLGEYLKCKDDVCITTRAAWICQILDAMAWVEGKGFEVEKINVDDFLVDPNDGLKWWNLEGVKRKEGLGKKDGTSVDGFEDVLSAIAGDDTSVFSGLISKCRNEESVSASSLADDATRVFEATSCTRSCDSHNLSAAEHNLDQMALQKRCKSFYAGQKQLVEIMELRRGHWIERRGDITGNEDGDGKEESKVEKYRQPDRPLGDVLYKLGRTPVRAWRVVRTQLEFQRMPILYSLSIGAVIWAVIHNRAIVVTKIKDVTRGLIDAYH